MMGIQVLDHVIVGTNPDNEGEGYSIRENHHDLWTEANL